MHIFVDGGSLSSLSLCTIPLYELNLSVWFTAGGYVACL